MIRVPFCGSLRSLSEALDVRLRGSRLCDAATKDVRDGKSSDESPTSVRPETVDLEDCGKYGGNRAKPDEELTRLGKCLGLLGFCIARSPGRSGLLCAAFSCCHEPSYATRGFAAWSR